MSNICDNKFFFNCKSNFDKWDKLICSTLKDHFEGDINFADIYEDGGTVEGYFESKWTFPLEVFEDLFNKGDAKEDKVYFRCLSEEYGCGYVAMNIFEDGSWKNEQTFNL